MPRRPTANPPGAPEGARGTPVAGGGGGPARRPGGGAAQGAPARLARLGARVLGAVVVVGVVGVEDRGAPIHLLDDQRRLQAAQEDVRDGPRDRVGEAPRHAWLDGGTRLPPPPPPRRVRPWS